ncbi:FHA domain-containing protein [Vibrio sp. S4M6]|uniref:FHA domain-containing protein n=1 Tax=Vibrio sinus TaxID=2946865 RepID=UPI00202A0D3A|nr:FHA domain-containing protein [Vibrio sinus]MCL9780078.1 FHA domain-containing protein [Vibrio sinus]
MSTNQLVINLTKHPEDYRGETHIEMPHGGGTIGRSSGCSAVLLDNNRFISSVHGMISMYGDDYYFSDVSTNGTLLNGQQVQKSQPISLHQGDRLSLGEYELTITIDQMSTHTDIAIDIEPNRDSTDPLDSLLPNDVKSNDVVLGERGQSTDQLFDATRYEHTEQDPIQHLTGASTSDSEAQVCDPIDSRHPQPANKSTRQLVDDSESMGAYFHAAPLIPDNWMQSNADSDTYNQQRSVQTEPNHVHSNATKSCDVSQNCVEEIDVSTPTRVAARQDHACLIALLKGLGIKSDADLLRDVHFFGSVGRCLRLCIDHFQTSLKNIDEMSRMGEESIELESVDIAEVMIALYKDKRLEPTELFEQVLAEMNLHEQRLAKARQKVTTDTVQELVRISSSRQSIDTKSRRFRQSLMFWKMPRDLLDEHLLNRLNMLEKDADQRIKMEYSQYIKDSHA